MDTAAVSTLIKKFNASKTSLKEHVFLGLINAKDMCSVSGLPSVLAYFERELNRAIPQAHWSYLETSLPFHSSLLSAVAWSVEQDRAFTQFYFKGTDLVCPVFQPDTGDNIQTTSDLQALCVDVMMGCVVNWPQMLQTVIPTLPQTLQCVIDVGPGPLTKLFTQTYCREHQIHWKQSSIDTKAVQDFLGEKRFAQVKAFTRYEVSTPDVFNGAVSKGVLSNRELYPHGASSTEASSTGIAPLKKSDSPNPSRQSISERSADMYALLFAGQGTQHLCMGESLFAKYPQEVEMAEDILGFSVEKLCMTGSWKDQTDLLDQTLYTQPCLFFVNALYTYEFWAAQEQENTVKPSFW